MGFMGCEEVVHKFSCTKPRKRLQNFENFEVPFMDSVGSMEGQRLVSDPMLVGSCVLRVP